MNQVAPSDHKQIVTADVVLLTVVEGQLAVGLITRESEPFAGCRALIGGYVHADKDEDTDATATRVLRQKTGLEGFFIEQLSTFSGPKRDPRGWSVSVTYLALTPLERLTKALGEGSGVSLTPVDEARDLPFDHAQVLAAAVGRLRSKGAYSTLPARLLPETFTLSELQATYQIAIGTARIDKSSFRRKLNELALIEPVDGLRAETGGRQAQLYRLRQAISVFERRL
jgi:8-oxo-dGTP diphosphatase